MAAGPTQKSVQITNLDATPAVENSAGNGAPGRAQEIDGWVTPAAADGTGTIYLMVRVKSSVVIKSVVLESEAQGAGKVQCGVYYADDSRYLAGGSGNAGVVINVNFFANDQDISSAFGPTNITYIGVGASYNISKRTQPLWQALGLATDPGGMFDIALTVHTTAITTGTGRTYLRVTYIEP